MTSAAPGHPSRTFAGLLAGFVAAEKQLQPEQNLDELDEDVDSLSYEHALRIHTRFRPVAPPAETGGDSAVAAMAHMVAGGPAAHSNSGPPGTIRLGETNIPSRSGRRCSSVTVRLSAPENEQLHLRAVEAKLTVSAYLRSCAFEVESLRAEVKAAVAQLRSKNATIEDQSRSEKRPSLLRFLTRISRRKPKS